MKIALVNTYDQKGGAARAVWRLYCGLRAVGAEATLLVQERTADDPSVISVSSPPAGLFNPLRPYVDFAIPFPMTRQRVLFSTALLHDGLLRELGRIRPDVVHLHWITGGFIRLETLPHLREPLVWTLHDMWPLTGGCHYTGECTRHLDQCGKCPLLHSARENDLSRSVFLRKQKVYQNLPNVILTAPSRWMADRIAESPLMGRFPVRVVPNGLDTAIFTPGDPKEARRRLNLPADKRIILFGAIRATETPSKGFSLLTEALRRIQRNDILLVVYGSDGPARTDISGLDVRFTGHVADPHKLVDLYTAADVTAVPSRQEVFGQAATESMACGTPVAAFDANGLRDIVVHEQTGFLARPFETASLAEGITWLLEDDSRRQALGRKARERMTGQMDFRVIARRMMDVYDEALHGRKS